MEVEAQNEEVHMINDETANILKVIANPDALKILYYASEGIGNSTYAIKELAITQKRYYYRLKELLTTELIKKKDGAYHQTELGRLIYDRILPTMEKAVDVKKELELIAGLEGAGLENSVRKRILDEIGIPTFTDSTNVRIDDYESMVIDVIDLLDESEESVLMASNHLDARVLDAAFRSMDRGVNNKFIIDREILSSKLQQLKMILSPKFAKTMMSFTSLPTDMSENARVTDIPYSFIVVDGHLNLIEISNAQVSFIAAFHVKNRGLGKKLTNLFEILWKVGESYSPLKFLSSFKDN